MKNKKFYDNINRNQKWTEDEKGRKIDFADKYITGADTSDKYDDKRPSPDREKKQKELKKKRITKVLSVFLCIVLIGAGYTCMDVYMTRHAEPVHRATAKSDDSNLISKASIQFASNKIESISLDSSVMLSSVISETLENDFNSVTFDVKRSDGTIGYASKLATVDTISALSSPASNPAASVKELLANDIMPIARVCCYRDNVMPKQIADTAVLKNGKIYQDSNANTYLNPNSETVFNYLSDIIQECYDFGIHVFVLYGCDLPKEIAASYKDGFEVIAQRLNDKFEGKIKILEEVDVTITGKDSESGKITNSAIKADIKKFDKIDGDKVYYISTKIDDEKAVSQLGKNNISRFILEN